MSIFRRLSLKFSNILGCMPKSYLSTDKCRQKHGMHIRCRPSDEIDEIIGRGVSAHLGMLCQKTLDHQIKVQNVI